MAIARIHPVHLESTGRDPSVLRGAEAHALAAGRSRLVHRRLLSRPEPDASDSGLGPRARADARLVGATEETKNASVEDYLEVIDRAVEHCSGRVNMMESDQVVATHDRPGDPCREGPVALPRAHRGRGPCRRTPAPPHGPQILGHSRLAIACDEEYAPGTSIGSAAVGTAERVIRKGIG